MVRSKPWGTLLGWVTVGVLGVAVTALPAPGASPTSLPELGPPVVMKAIYHHDDEFTLSVYPLQRQGDVMRLEVEIRVDRKRSATIDTRLVSNEHNYSDAKAIPNGFMLLDAQKKRLYYPASTSNQIDDAYCGPSLPHSLSEGEVHRIRCYYKDVPPSPTFQLRVRNFETLTNIPVEDAKAPFDLTQPLQSVGYQELIGTVIA